MKYRISLRHPGDHEGVTFNEVFDTFDEAWTRARILVDPMVDEAEHFELKFSKVRDGENS